MKVIYVIIFFLVFVVLVFLYGKHIGYQQAELEAQKASNEANNQGNKTNDKATEMDKSIYYNDITCKL